MKTWNVDKAHSSIGFNVKHMMFSKIDGHFEDYEASIAMKDANLENAQIKFEAKADSVTTHNEDRDNHLKTQDFFSAGENPKVEFESTNITKNGANKYTVEGDLTMNGITKPVKLDAEYSGVMADPWGNDRIALIMTSSIKRAEWNMSFNQTLESGGVLVGKEVNFDIESQFI